jgi:hypothetical protein
MPNLRTAFGYITQGSAYGAGCASVDPCVITSGANVPYQASRVQHLGTNRRGGLGRTPVLEAPLARSSGLPARPRHQRVHL